MYALQTHREVSRRWHHPGRLAWRARWAIAALGAAALLGVGYAREAARSSLVSAGVPAASERVTVAPGDTLWSIATRRYPEADAREKVFEIEQLNGLSGPTIVVGQRLRVPAS